jgi:ElaA protein
MTSSPCISYNWYLFDQLARDDIYELLQLRQQVFVVEQKCAYLDADGLDQYSWHLFARMENGTTNPLAGYLRVIFPGKKYTEPAIGRLLTTQSVRGAGIGRKLMQEACRHLAVEYPEKTLRISAQLYLKKFYEELGFVTVTEAYDEDGIQHIEMIRPAR